MRLALGPLDLRLRRASTKPSVGARSRRQVWMVGGLVCRPNIWSISKSRGLVSLPSSPHSPWQPSVMRTPPRALPPSSNGKERTMLKGCRFNNLKDRLAAWAQDVREQANQLAPSIERYAIIGTARPADKRPTWTNGLTHADCNRRSEARNVVAIICQRCPGFSLALMATGLRRQVELGEQCNLGRSFSLGKMKE